MKRMACVVAAVIGLAASAVLAQVDTSSPRAAVKSLYAAVGRGDAAAVQQVLHIENDPNQALVGGYANLILSSKKLSDAVRQKFPGAQSELSQGTITPEDAAKIDAGNLKVEGDKATLEIAGQPSPTMLRRNGGGWRVVAGEGADPDPKANSQRVELITSLIEVMNKSAEEIAADKYASVQDAEAAVKARLGAVFSKAIQANAPTSRPASRPAQQP